MFFTEHIVLLILGVLVITGFLIIWRRKNADFKYRRPPSLPCLPLLGSLPFIRNFSNITVFFKDKAKELGPIFTLRIGNSTVLVLNTKEAIEKAFVKHSSVFSNRPEFLQIKVINPENKGIAFKPKATEWKKSRQLSLSILKEFGFGVKSVMETKIFEEIEAMTELVQKKNEKSFDPKNMCVLAASNVMTNILFGHRREYDMGPSDFFQQTQRYDFNLSNVYDIIPIIKYFPPFRQQMKEFIESAEIVIRCIDRKILQTMKETAKPCFVQSYIQKEGPEYDREELRYVLLDFMSAGAGTSCATLQWCFLTLANYPDVQKRLHAEIDAVIPGDRLPSLQDEAMLPYVHATILELNRWRTLVPLSVPRETAHDSIVDGYFIPARTMVIANLYAAHYDTNVWKDPEIFRPERFLDSENNVIGQERIIPFSIGKRSCLGESLARAELFLILTSFVKRFLILPEEGQDKLNEDPILPISIVTHPMPFKIRLIQRK